jgi:hypothetical protein
MTQIQSISRKNTSIKLSDQVKNYLSEKGYSALFNYSDYQYYKQQVKEAFNKAYTIAELFISENNQNESDFNEYLF